MLVPSGSHAKYRSPQNAESPCNPRSSRVLNPKIAHSIPRRPIFDLALWQSRLKQVSARLANVNGSCKFINRTLGFVALLQAYLDFPPVRERRVTAPNDCRSDGTSSILRNDGARTLSLSTSTIARFATSSSR
jgi:hypothetical protein